MRKTCIAPTRAISRCADITATRRWLNRCDYDCLATMPMPVDNLSTLIRNRQTKKAVLMLGFSMAAALTRTDKLYSQDMCRCFLSLSAERGCDRHPCARVQAARSGSDSRFSFWNACASSHSISCVGVPKFQLLSSS